MWNETVSRTNTLYGMHGQSEFCYNNAKLILGNIQILGRVRATAVWDMGSIPTCVGWMSPILFNYKPASKQILDAPSHEQLYKVKTSLYSMHHV